MRLFNKYIIFFSLFFITYLLSNCQVLKDFLGFNFITPKAEVSSIEIKNLSFGKIDFILNIKIENPNDSEININKLLYDIKVDNLKLAKGVTGQGIKIAAQKIQNVDLLIKVDAFDALKIIKAIMESKNDKKHIASIKGTVFFNTSIGTIKYDFSGQKELGLKL